MLRPFDTFSPLNALDNTLMNCEVTYGSSTIVVRLVGGLVAPSNRVARSAASRAALSKSKSLGESPTENPKPVWVSSPSSAKVTTET